MEEEAWNDYFYSRPCGRGDPYIYGEQLLVDVFLLTPLREGRLLSFSTASAVSTISTHAPAGGATAHRTSARSCGFHFYSRPCGRGDSARRAAATSSPAFLLTPLREGRHNRIPNRMMVSYFYSRPCGRGDVRTFTRNHIIHVISTHAPAGGATPRAGKSVRCTPYFYSRPCGRGDVILRLTILINQ